MFDPIDEPSCRVCGCTDGRACLDEFGACHWVDDDLCSACAQHAGEIPSPASFPNLARAGFVMP